MYHGRAEFYKGKDLDSWEPIGLPRLRGAATAAEASKQTKVAPDYRDLIGPRAFNRSNHGIPKIMVFSNYREFFKNLQPEIFKFTEFDNVSLQQEVAVTSTRKNIAGEFPHFENKLGEHGSYLLKYPGF